MSDPAWFLARQWQTRAFAAADGGDPVSVAIATTTAPIRTPTGQLTRPDLEAEPAPALTDLNTAARVRLASEIARFLRDAGIAPNRSQVIRSALAAAFPLQPITTDASLTPYSGRVPDAAALATQLATSLKDDGTGELPVVPGVDPHVDPQLEPALRAWYSWIRRADCALDGNGDTTPPLWDPARLSYQAKGHVQLPGGILELNLQDYNGTGFDWYCMDRGTLAPAATTPAPARVVKPAPVTFVGMPNPRFWAFERGDVNLDIMAGKDQTHAILATFAHAYSNEWFLIPLDVDPGATIVDLLEVTDSFGASSTILAAAALDVPSGLWRMWDLTTDTPVSDDAALGIRVFFPPAAPPLERPDIEDLLVARDEMANLGWVIERTVRDGDGTQVDRNRRWLRLRPPGDPSYNPAAATDGAGSWRLGTSLPDYWYPLLNQTDEKGTQHLALAELPPGAADVSDEGVEGHLIAHDPATRLADEEASRTATRITRVARLARTGVRRAWQARVHQPGTGEPASGLRFDVLGAPAIAPNLVRNGDFTWARRQQPTPLIGGSVPGTSAAEHWGLWNNSATTTTTRVEPTRRPGGTGWMLRVSTGADGCGLVQQWADTNTGPANAQAEAWVYVLRGTVSLGSGNGGNTNLDVESSTSGQWERLMAPSGRTPVNEVILYATSPAGAEFFVDSVSVRTTT